MLNHMNSQNLISNRRLYFSKVTNISNKVRLLASSRRNSINIHITLENFIATPQIQLDHKNLRTLKDFNLFTTFELIAGEWL